MYMPSLRHWSCKYRPNARVILHCSIVWCWGTPSTRECSGFTAIRFRRKCSMEVIAWTPSWFGRRALIMELSLYRQRQSGMLMYCSCSLPLLWPTLDRSPWIVPSSQPWKHMMILKMVFICIIQIIAIIAIMWNILHYYNYSHYNDYFNYCWFVSCRMVGVCWISCGIRAWLQETYPVRRPIQSILGKLPLMPVGDTGTIPHSMRNAFSGAHDDRRPGAGDGCRMWFVNSWALGWSRDLQ